MYTQAIQQLDGVVHGHNNLGVLRFSFPNLKRIGTMAGDTCSWHLNQHGMVARAVYTLADWDNAPHWRTIVKSIKTKLPDDWPVVFQPAEVRLVDDITATRWVKEMSQGEIVMPLKVRIDKLNQTTFDKLLAFVTTLERAHKVSELQIKLGTLDAAGEVNANCWHTFGVYMTAWKGLVQSLRIRGAYVSPGRLRWVLDSCAGMEGVAFMIQPQADYFRERMLQTTPRHPLEQGFTPKSPIDVHMTVVVGHPSRAAPGADDTLDTLKSDRAWLKMLAKELLSICGPTARHVIAIHDRGDGRGKADPRMTSDGAFFTHMLNDTIETIIECQRVSMPRGYHGPPPRRTKNIVTRLLRIRADVTAQATESDDSNMSLGSTSNPCEVSVL